MQIAITKQMWEALQADRAKHQAALSVLLLTWEVGEDSFRWSARSVEIGIENTPASKLKTLYDSFTQLSPARGYAVAARAIKTYLGGQDTTGQTRAKSVEQFVLLFKAYFSRQPHTRVYQQDEGASVWRAYSMAEVEYHAAQLGRGWYQPPYASVDLVYREFGQVCGRSIHINEKTCLWFVPTDALRAVGLYVETEDLRAAYLAERDRWDSLATKIGFQCLGRGIADDDCDGNPSKEHGNRWYWKRNVITLDAQNEPSRVVIDLFSEEEKENEKPYPFDQDFWKKARGVKTPDEDAEEIEEVDDDDEPDAAQARMREESGVEVPVHPLLVVFDMKRHLRLKVHVSQLEEYVYDTKLGTRLILPQDVRDLVTVLLTQKSMFQDVIAGKGGGLPILCSGPPGTGKTLTAEVYAEVMKRPLYSVQTAQLGTTAAELENELRRVFARAQRWGAILLLDEADVYVRSRGDDLGQNAIVGVFLRTLEYFQGVLFLTTNRADAIDDAIASRCVAHIRYRIPHPNDQKKIWRVIADSSNTHLTDESINEIVTEHGMLSGRDIKNLAKLAKMISESKKKPVDVEMITFVKRFKPTGVDLRTEEVEEQEGGGVEGPRARAPRAS